MSREQESTSDLYSAVGEQLPASRTALSFAAGDCVCREGDPGDTAFLVESGSLRVSRTVFGRERTIALAGPGELIGELSLLDPGVRAATVTATTDAELLVVTPEQLEREMRASPPLVRLLLRVLVDRFRSVSSLTEGDDETVLDDFRFGEQNYQDTTQIKAVHEVRLERQLGEAIRNEEFELHYQPVVNLRARKLVGFEALVRWRRPNAGLVSPSDFIWLAERSGLIVPLGAWILESAARFARDMRSYIDKSGSGAAAPFISVNVSPRQLENSTSVDQLVGVLEQSRLSPKALKLEITESMLLENPEASIRALQRLKAVGTTLAVDDFGTGYASLSYMARYPLDTLKIDRSFVVGIEDAGNRQVIRSMVVLARGLGLDIVAEGVETREQLAALAALRCDNGQGYLFSRPLPAEQAMRMVKRAVTTRTRQAP